MNFETVIPTNKKIERLQTENPWWSTGTILPMYSEMAPRLYFDIFYSFLTERTIRRSIVLMGPRRVGKSVMMYHSIEKLIENGVSPKKILFAGIDNPIYMQMSLEDILDLTKLTLDLKDVDDCYVFFDEIQYLKDWERHLKVLTDGYPKTKFIVSGSAAAALKLRSNESGAGRFTNFLLPPITFHEYIHLRKLHHLLELKSITYGNKQIPFYTTHDHTKLNEEFFKYINFGGYPEVLLSEEIQKDMSRYVKSDILDKVLLRDLPSLYGIKDVQELNRFFSYLAYNTGLEFSYEKMGKESGISKEMLKKYLEYLEAAFLIKVIHKVDEQAKSFKRITSFKVYLTNTSLRTALFTPIVATDPDTGSMVETAIFSQWMHRETLQLNYARWKMGRSEGEVDIVLVDQKMFKPQWCLEIKYSNRYFEKPNELKSLIEFCKLNGLNATLVTSIDAQGVKTIENIDITFVSAAVYAYNIGVNTLEKKSTW